LGAGVEQSGVPPCGAASHQPCIRPGATTGGAARAGGAAHLHARAAGARLGRAGAGRAGRAGAHLAAHAPRRGGDLCAAQRLLPAPCRQARRGGCQPRNAGRWARRTGGACMSMRHGDAARRRLAQLLRTTAGARIAWPAQGGRARACRLCAAGGAAARGAGAGARDGRAGHPAEPHRHAPPAGVLAAGPPGLNRGSPRPCQRGAAGRRRARLQARVKHRLFQCEVRPCSCFREAARASGSLGGAQPCKQAAEHHSGAADPQAWTYKKLGFPVPYLVVGRWGVTPFPAPTPLRFVVGEPLTALEPGAMVRVSSSVGSMRACWPRVSPVLCGMCRLTGCGMKTGNMPAGEQSLLGLAALPCASNCFAACVARAQIRSGMGRTMRRASRSCMAGSMTLWRRYGTSTSSALRHTMMRAS
jgi:hypothetical protein